MLSNRSMPGCAVIPVLTYPDIDEAIAWLCSAFGFTVRLQIGNHRAQLNVGDGAMIMAKQDSAYGNHSREIMARVENV